MFGTKKGVTHERIGRQTFVRRGFNEYQSKNRKSNRKLSGGISQEGTSKTLYNREGL